MSDDAGEGQGVRTVKIFVSSPGDVMAERQRLQRVVDRLNGRLGGAVVFRTVRWEEQFYRSHSSFQNQIDAAASCDIVVSIFWTRLGTELPPEFNDKLPDGRPYPSGTAYEVLTALEAAKQRPLPDVYVFKKNQRALYPDNETEAQAFETQVRRLTSFWKEWFVSDTGHFRAAFNNFTTTDEFEAQVEELLQEWLATKGMSGRKVRWRIEERGSPFRGLLPFEADHAEVFLGRGGEIERASELMADSAQRGVPFLLVLGASGSGKSSLARAGLIPNIMKPGGVDGVDLWRVARLTLGLGDPDPLKALANALLETEALPELATLPNGSADGIATQLGAGGEGAVNLVGWALDRLAERERTAEGYDRPVAARLMLLADQFEALFASTVSPERRRAFIAALDELVRSGRVWLIATLRSTDYANLQGDAVLLKLKEQGATFDLAPPDAVALAEAIEGPAEAAGLAFDKDSASGRSLDEILRADAGGADALPLLQFTLQHLFETREVREGVPTLTLAAYVNLGGIEGAIAAEAERAVSALPAQAQDQLPWLLRHLAAAGRPGSGTVALREMVLEDAELAKHPGAARLIEALAGARVLILDASGDAGIPGGGRRRGRLAHEAVLRRWERARAFVAANARNFQLQAALQGQLERWLAENRDRDALLRGTALAQGEELAAAYGEELSAEARDYVKASRRMADRGKRVAYAIAAGMAVLFVGAAAGGYYAYEQYNVAETERAAAFRERAAAEVQRAEAERQKGEAERQKAEAERQRAEAEKQKGEAEQRRAEAESNFNVARQTADTLVTDLAFGLRDSEGMQAATIAKILESAGRAYGRLAGVAANDPELMRSQSTMYMAFADTWVAQGDLARATKAGQDAVAINRRLVERTPDNMTYQRELSSALNTVVDTLVPQRRFAEAEQLARESLGIILKVARSQPTNAGWQADLALAFNKVGDSLVDQGKYEDAIDVYEPALAIRERLLRFNAENQNYQRDVSVSLERVADVHAKLKSFDEALKMNRQALAMRERLAIANSTNLRSQRDLSIAHNKIGDTLRAQGKKPEALKAYRDSSVIAERLARIDPTNIHLQFDVVTIEWRLAQEGDEPVRRWEWIVRRLRQLSNEGRLSAEQVRFLPIAEENLRDVRAK